MPASTCFLSIRSADLYATPGASVLDLGASVLNLGAYSGAFDLRSALSNIIIARHDYEHVTLSSSTTQVLTLQIAQIVRLPALSYVSKFGAD